MARDAGHEGAQLFRRLETPLFDSVERSREGFLRHFVRVLDASKRPKRNHPYAGMEALDGCLIQSSAVPQFAHSSPSVGGADHGGPSNIRPFLYEGW